MTHTEYIRFIADTLIPPQTTRYTKEDLIQDWRDTTMSNTSGEALFHHKPDLLYRVLYQETACETVLQFKWLNNWVWSRSSAYQSDQKLLEFYCKESEKLRKNNSNAKKKKEIQKRIDKAQQELSQAQADLQRLRVQ